jgi:hypothetical protein
MRDAFANACWRAVGEDKATLTFDRVCGEE